MNLSEYQKEYDAALAADAHIQRQRALLKAKRDALAGALREADAELEQTRGMEPNHHLRALVDRIFFNATKGAKHEPRADTIAGPDAGPDASIGGGTGTDT